ncbi:MAG TPA: zinc ribbon domain-containing protein [Aggregatilineales bacterium]|nr:zinc ribbon domain-containing protein [Aggregatilineales bacterium]
MGFDATISELVLFLATATGAVVAALWLGIVLWTWRDLRARSRDRLAQGAAALMVAVLNVFGLVIYLMLRPRETLAEAYERSLEEEALLQGIEDKPLCPGCGRATKPEWQVCPYCYTRLKKPCIQCGQLIELSWNMCPYCATQQAAEPRSGRRARADRPARQNEAVEQHVEFVEGDES